MWNIAFCINDAYVKYICVTIKSIIENNKDKEICFHVLTDDIRDKNKKILREIIGSQNKKSLKIHEVDDTPLKGLKTSQWTKYTWYRILLPQYLPDVATVLYLDADTLVVDNLEELFNINMSNNSIAGVLDQAAGADHTYKRCRFPQEKLYICAGVLIMNLEYWRKHNLTEKIINWAKIHDDIIALPDQDTINNICQDSKLILPLRFGVLNDYFKKEFFWQPKYLKELKECIEKPIIIHYTNKPWHINAEKHVLYPFWIKYNKMLKKPVKRIIDFTPFYKVNAKGIYKIKTIVWNLLHCLEKKNNLSIQQVREQIDRYEKILS